MDVVQTDAGMSWLQFVAAMTSSLAWPAAAVIIASLFRAQIADLLAKLRRLTWGDKAVDFSEKLDAIENQARNVPHAALPTSTAAASAQLSNEERLNRLIEVSPSIAIVDAWQSLEQRLLELRPPASKVGGSRLGPSGTINYLQGKKLIPPSVASLLKELLVLKNAAAHGGKASGADAYRFRALTDGALQALSLVQTSDRAI